ncbi:hypothetical protein NP233_g3520 [Leucocoprinus birnbaumii]|uniref:F-box domain-containing protein n=1 Tax=Leucocoprinus birnbaumii TaxID=56174 RepID=A0AAD5YTT8_9AGAR|nr:hypothetical protein NP233_g3520 [Leucocoprinus birnbaumii]
MTTIPSEILTEIFIRCSPDGTVENLKNSSLVCSYWQFPAQYELFSRAVFTIKSTDAPSPGSTPYTTLVNNERYSYFRSTVHILRLRLKAENPDLDPGFSKFLTSLSSVKTLHFADPSDQFLTIDPGEAHAILRVLLGSPGLNRLIVDTATFPLFILPYAKHISCLSWSSAIPIIAQSPKWIPPEVSTGTSPVLSSLTSIQLGGTSKSAFLFTQWNHGIEQWAGVSYISFAKLRRLTLRLDDFKFNLRRLFNPFTLITHLTLHCTIHAFLNSPLCLDVRLLQNLLSFTFKANTLKDDEYLPFPRSVMMVLHHWAFPIIRSLSHPQKLRDLEINILSAIVQSPSETLSDPLVPAAHHLLNSLVMTRYPKLQRFRFCVPWLTHNEVLSTFSDLRNAGIEVSSLPLDSDHM